MHHDEFIRQTVATVAATDPAPLARAWVASLSTRDHALRGAWGSRILLSHLAPHAFEPSTVFHPSGCAVCGLGVEVEPVSEDRLAGAGYRFLVASVDWAAADVVGAASRLADAPTAVDPGTLGAVLDALAALPEDAQLAQLNAALIGVITSDKYERMRLLEQLGLAGILRPSGHPSYAEEWIRWEDANQRQPKERNKREWAYPVRFWTGSDGVDREAAQRMFGAR